VATFCWFVPGFMGSTLSLYSTVGHPQGPNKKLLTLWGDLSMLNAPEFVWSLRVGGTLPDNTEIRADGLAPSSVGGYTDLLQWLVANLPFGWTLAPWAHDWRQSARDLGRQFATLLEANFNKGNSNVVLAHSYGALIAWAAYAYLVDDGKTDALQRLTTMGGALYGTNSTPSIFREQETAIGMLAVFGQLWGGSTAAGIGMALFGVPESHTRDLLGLVASWPAVYDLYPDVRALDDPGDSKRADVFNQSLWTAALAQPNWTLMQTEVTRLHQWLRVSQYEMPGPKVNHIVGLNTATPYRVQDAATRGGGVQNAAALLSLSTSAQARRLLQLPQWGTNRSGDGRCMDTQQEFPGRYWQMVSSPHASMQDDPAVRRLAVQMLQMTNPAPPPPTPLQVQPIWQPPRAVPSMPQFLIDNSPININPPPPVLPVRVGVDP
jgi:hypothetical protein